VASWEYLSSNNAKTKINRNVRMTSNEIKLSHGSGKRKWQLVGSL